MNDEQLASDIRRAFGRYHAAPRPIDALATTLASQPGVAETREPARPPLLARRRLLGGLSFAGVAAAVLLAFALTLGIAPGGGSPQSVWAAWQPIPTTPDEALRKAAPEKCGAQLQSLTGDRVPGSSFLYSDLQLVAQDQRGPAAMFMFARDTTFWACMVWPNEYGSYNAIGLSSSSEAHPLACHLEPLVEGGALEPVGTFSPSNPQLVTIYGRTDGSKVLVRRPDGVQVQATVNDGVFVAWWPGGGQPTNLVAYDDRGHELQAVAGFGDNTLCQASPAATDKLS